MIKVDTFFDGRDVCERLGLYYIVKDGAIISPPFATLKDAQKNAWKYTETVATAAAEEIKPAELTSEMVVNVIPKIEEVNTSSFDNIAQNFYEKEKLLRECLYFFHTMKNPPITLQCAIEHHLGIKFVGHKQNDNT